MSLSENLPTGSLIIDLNSKRNYSNLFEIKYTLNSSNIEKIYFYFQNGQLILKHKFDCELQNEINLQILCFNITTQTNLQLNIVNIFNIKLNIVKFNNQKPQFAYISYNFSLNIEEISLNQTEKYFIDYIKAYNKYSQSTILYYLQSYDELNDDGTNDYDSFQASARSMSIQNNNGKFKTLK